MDNFFKKHRLEVLTAKDYLLHLLQDVLSNVTSSPGDEPIVEHMMSRVKSDASVIEKLERRGLEVSEESALKNLSDIIGVRIVVRFVGDIYKIVDILRESERFNIVLEKDYVQNSKPSGYRGFHVIVEILLNDIKIQAEIQLRTVAMDSWASLEHLLRYKKDYKEMNIVNKELKKCSDDLMSADITMEQIRKVIEQNKDK